MKKSVNRLARQVVFAAAVTLVGFASSTSSVQAQIAPDGAWDLVVSGSQRGLAQITFNPDFTLEGVEIITFKRTTGTSSDDDNPRGNSDETRGGTTIVSGSTTNFYGMGALTGSWTFDNSQRVIGFFSLTDGTNTVSAVSFTALVRTNLTSRKITLNGVSNGKSITYKGIPLNALPDISGEYYGQGKVGGSPFNEVLTFAPSGDPNTYDVTGAGPAYEYAGFVMVSAQKQMAFVSLLDYGNDTTRLRSVTGSYNPTKAIASMTGLIETGDSVTNTNVKLVKQP